MNYVWINPVVKKQYCEENLKKTLLDNGYVEIFPKKNHIEVVKYKYCMALEENDKIICDMRCPKAVNIYKKNNIDLYYPDIEPILIHIAREFAERDDLKGKNIFIIIPCKSLKDYGNSLNIENMYFETWKNFKEEIFYFENHKNLSNSPIPMGFFDEFGVNVSKKSGDNLLKFCKKARIIEALYCKNGCHNGDGVIND